MYKYLLNNKLYQLHKTLIFCKLSTRYKIEKLLMIEFVNVTKSYPGILALDDISFEIDEGEFTFLTGISGSGKTTIIKLLIKEEEPTEGKIFFYDTDLSNLKGKKVSRLRQEIGVVFQDFKLLPNKNLYENIAFALEVSGKKLKDIEETVPYVLKLVDLSDRAESFPSEISGGEKQKIAIARAIANNPKVLIADEPTGNLDSKSSWEIIDLLSKINDWGTTVIMATHGTDIVDTMGKRVVNLDKGKIVSDNKKGYSQQPTISLNADKKRKKKSKKTESKSKKKIDKSKIVKGKPKKEEEFKTNGIKEKEFDITFTTKSSFSSKRKKKKRAGKDVVDLHILKLPNKIEETLIKTGISSIKQLKNTSSSKLVTKGFTKKEIKIIYKKLEKSRKK